MLSTLDVPLPHYLARSTALFGMTSGFVKTRAFQAELVDQLLKLLRAHLGGNAGNEALDQRQPFRERHRVCVIDELADGRMVEGFGLAACCHSQNLRALKQGVTSMGSA